MKRGGKMQIRTIRSSWENEEEDTLFIEDKGLTPLEKAFVLGLNRSVKRI